MKIRQKVHGNVTTQRNIAVAAVAADSGHLDRALVDVHVVDLIRFGRRMGARDRDIDWSIDRDTDIEEDPREVAASAITIDSRYLDSSLFDVRVVGLISFGRGAGARDRDVYRMVDDDRGIHQRS